LGIGLNDCGRGEPDPLIATADSHEPGAQWCASGTADVHADRSSVHADRGSARADRGSALNPDRPRNSDCPRNFDCPCTAPINYPITQSPDYQIRESGFTLIELTIVITMLVILASISLVQHTRSLTYAKEAVLKEDLFRMRDAIDQYYADKNKYPATLDALVSEGYLRKIPEDPFTKDSSTWQTVPAEPDPGNPTAEAGIYDVKSGSDATALDGTKYAEWD
jgi:general secretion pathway protein G